MPGKENKMEESILKIAGFSRVRITEDTPDGPKIVGDSGWGKNQITNLGVRNYLAYSLGSIAASSYVSYAALGSGSEPGAAATTLDLELAENVRDQVTAASNGSTSVRFTGTFASGDNFVTATRNISNIGLFRSSTGGTLFAGNTYTGSSCATNQNVNYTYDITFTTT
jgi:hypothetical protein